MQQQGHATQTPGPARWWRRDWGVAAIATGALLVGVVIGAAVAAPNSKPAPSVGQLAAQAKATQARAHSEAVERAQRAREQAAEERAAKRRAREEARQQRREEAKEHAEQARQAQREREAAARKRAEETKTYSGSGGENIGTIHLSTESTLHWECACSGDNFQIFNSAGDENNITVNALNQTSGETHLDEGTYHDVVVNTEGESWTIHITPNE